MSITVVVAIDDNVELATHCAAEAPIVSSASLSVSIGVVDAPECPAVPVGGGAGGDVGFVAAVGLGVDCGGDALPDCASNTTVKSSVAVDGVAAIVTNCLAVARELSVEPKQL
eukprot:1909476-Amphidinium_carterae.1